MTSSRNLARIAALTHAAEARGRTIEEQADQAKQVPAADVGSQQQRLPTAQPDQGRGAGGRGCL